MIKYYCDRCEQELTDRNRLPHNDIGRLQSHFKLSNGKVMRAEIITGTDSTANLGHYCKYCIIDCINTLDDRSKLDASEDDILPGEEN